MTRDFQVEELPDGPPAIAGVATSVALFIGWASRGPTDQALQLKSFSDYERDYGGLDRRSLLGYAVRQFYDNGGADAHVIRIKGDDDAVIGPADAAFQEQLNALFEADGAADRIDLFNVICVPGLVDGATIQAMQRQARARRAFLIVDCAETDTVATVIDSLADRSGADAINSALFFPWLKAPDPLQQNAPRAFPPCGFVAGVFARTDAARGVWKAPAGVDARVVGATGLTVAIGEADNARLSRRAINCLRSFPDAGIVVFGARTPAGGDDLGSEWKFIPVRRIALFLEESLLRGSQWAALEPNDEPLWAKLRASAGTSCWGCSGKAHFRAQRRTRPSSSSAAATPPAGPISMPASSAS
jgi:phage tail sheath protein FI